VSRRRLRASRAPGRASVARRARISANGKTQDVRSDRRSVVDDDGRLQRQRLGVVADEIPHADAARRLARRKRETVRCEQGGSVVERPVVQSRGAREDRDARRRGEADAHAFGLRVGVGGRVGERQLEARPRFDRARRRSGEASQTFGQRRRIGEKTSVSVCRGGSQRRE